MKKWLARFVLALHLLLIGFMACFEELKLLWSEVGVGLVMGWATAGFLFLWNWSLKNS